MPNWNHRLLRSSWRVHQNQDCSYCGFHRQPLLPLGMDQHPTQTGRSWRDEHPASIRQIYEHRPQLRSSQWGERHPLPWAVHHRQERHLASNNHQRSSSWTLSRRDSASGTSIPVHRWARRGLPRQLDPRKKDYEARPIRKQGIFPGFQLIILFTLSYVYCLHLCLLRSFMYFVVLK